MKRPSESRFPVLLFCLWLLGPLAVAPLLPAQNTTQELVFAGLRSVAQQGQAIALQTDGAGNLYLLLNQGDGVRIIKTDNAASMILAQTVLGAAGDAGVALALDPAGNVYVAGTSSSGQLSGTTGTAFPTRTDNSVNSFVARFDASLNPVFVTFTGGSRISVAGLAVTADAVFVTGITYASNLPVTPNGIQQTPAFGSTQNGFVERFSNTGATLVYATYLSGASGDTTPAAIAADATDAAYVTGETSASGFPTLSALTPLMLSNPSGFLTRLTPAGDGLTWSTFVPGAGLTSIALDSTGSVLLVSGSIALGQFPVDTVQRPLVPATYQVLLRIPIDGSTVLSSTLLAPGTQTQVAAALNGGAWVDGTLSAPLLPLAPLLGMGSGFAVHVPAGAAIDQTARFGGLPTTHASYASLPLTLTGVAVDPAGEAIVAGSIQPTASSNLLATETYDLPLRNALTPALPSQVSNATVTAATCTGSLCAGSAAYVAKLATASGAAALSFSTGDLPFIVLRNLGTTEADGLSVTATGATLSSNCPATLYGGGQCDILLAGGKAGTLTAAASNAGAQTFQIPSYSAALPASTIVVSPRELDFGVQTSVSTTGTRIITVTNLGPAAQTFASQLDVAVNPKGGVTYPWSEVASDCTLNGGSTSKILAAGATCHITIGFTAPSSSSSDGFLNSDWLVGTRDVLLTGYSQAAQLGVSATEVDFGTQYSNGIQLPRYLYLSNASTQTVPHSAATLPTGSAFTLLDGCASTLLPASVCRIKISYHVASSTSTDSATLTLDQGLTVLLTGKTIPPQTVTGTTVNPNLSVTPASVSFANAVLVTGTSSSTQTITVSNTGTATIPLSLSLSGDFTDATSCGVALTGGQSCSVVVTFAPSQPGSRQGLLAVTAGASTSPAYVALSGTGTALLPANNGTLDQGSIPVGQPVAEFYKVSQPVTSLTAAATGSFSLVLVEDTGFGPATPAASAYAATITGTCSNCYLGVRFQPASSGLQTGTLTLTSVAGGSPYVLELTGTGTATNGLILSPAAQDFGSVPIHSSSGSQLVTLTNALVAGTAVTLISAATTGDFALTTAVTGGQACAGTLSPGASCQVQLAFAPTATGARTGTVTFTTSSGTVSAALTGNGLADPGIAINPLGLTFNNVPGASATRQSITVTNTGSVPIAVGLPSTTSAPFSAASTCGTVASGASCTIGVTFAPTSATVTDTLSIPVTTTSGTPSTITYTVALSGAYTSGSAGLEVAPGLAQFGPLAVGQQSPSRLFTINNLTARSVLLTLTVPRQFTLTSPPCSALAPGASCSFSAAFVPLTNGTISGSIQAQATPTDGSAGSSAIGYAEGYGVGTNELTVTGGLIVNSVYSFGQVTSGQSKAQVFTLANNNAAGTPALTVRRVTSAPPFLSTTTCGSPLAPGGTCTVTVSYTPSNQVATGTTSAQNTTDAGLLTLESDSTDGPNVLNLTGQGAPVAVTSPVNAATLASFTLSQGSLNFPQTAIGNTSAAQTVTFSNTGTQTIHVAGVTTSADFSASSNCSAVVPGASCLITVAATPQSGGTRVASVEIASDATVALEYITVVTTASPAALTLAPGSLNFGAVQVGTASTLPLVVSNASGSAVVFSSVSATGDYSVGGSCPAAGVSLAAGTSCTLQITFKPAAAGTRSGTLSIANGATTNPLTAPLTGIGLQSVLVVSPSHLSFGSIALGSPATLTLTLQNSGGAAITGVSFTATGDFAVTAPCAQTVLAAGTSCAAQITFTPAALGVRTGTLTIISSDPSSPLAVPLTGTGIQGGGFTLTVDGAQTSNNTVVSGTPANYALLVTPTGGYMGQIALTCSPINAAPDAGCSLLPSVLTLVSAQTSIATLTTVTSVASAEMLPSAPKPAPNQSLQRVFLSLLVPGVLTLWRGRRQLRSRRKLLLAMLFASATFFVQGCGSSGDINLRYTPAGTYQYSVTASSTSGVALTQTVTLNLTVTSR